VNADKGAFVRQLGEHNLLLRKKNAILKEVISWIKYESKKITNRHNAYMKGWDIFLLFL
jgi:hypothetical protein